MRIESSQISLAATHRSDSFTLLAGQTSLRGRIPNPPSDTVHLSRQAESLIGSPFDLADPADLDPKEMLVVLAVESMLGRKLNLFRPRPFGAGSGQTVPAEAPQASAVQTTTRRTRIHSESERTTFQAQGEVTLAGGRTIRFSASLMMQREFHSASTSTAQPAAATDPLVLNFGGAPARATEGTIDFDLNSDGRKESINFVASDSGFLALDRNGDGRVNDGSELFGPQSGSGFAELAAYDADGNGWIDEADPVFAQLRLWTRDAQGNDNLSSLTDTGIGAIAVASAATPFSLTGAGNVLQAEIRSTGIYLRENGSAGTVQQLDLVSAG